MITSIIVCCHKEDIVVSDYPYLPVQVGKALSSQDLEIQGDDTGDNISSKNKNFCELTGLYWAWKNIDDADIIGLCHYRRYFDFHKQAKAIIPYTLFSAEKFNNLDFSVPEKILKKVKSGKVVVPRAINNVRSPFEEYCIAHYSDDARILGKVVKEMSPDNYKKAYDKVMRLTHKPHCFNMFIMNREDFDKYCSWLFPILFEVEKRVDISNYSVAQKRIFGYMSERLFNVFLEAERKKTIKKPLIFIMPGKQWSTSHYVIKSWLNNISFYISTLYIRILRN